MNLSSYPYLLPSRSAVSRCTVTTDSYRSPHGRPTCIHHGLLGTGRLFSSMMTSYGRVPDLLLPSRCCLLHFHVSMSPCLTSCCERLHMVTMSGDIECLLAGKDHPSDLLKPASLLLLRPFLPTMRLVCNFNCSCAFACPSPGSIPCCKQSFYSPRQSR